MMARGARNIICSILVIIKLFELEIIALKFQNLKLIQKKLIFIKNCP